MSCYVCGELFKKNDMFVDWNKGFKTGIVRVHKGCVGIYPDGMNRINNFDWTKGKGMIDDSDRPVVEGRIEKDEQTPEAEKMYDILREIWRTN